MQTGADTPSSSPTVIQLLIIIIPSALLFIVLLALPPSIAVLVWCRKGRGKINLCENFTEQNTDEQVNGYYEIPIAQVQRVNETESEALYSSINDNTSPTSQQNHNRPEAVQHPAAGDQSDDVNQYHTIYDIIGSSTTQEEGAEPTYNTLTFRAKPKMKATESGSHLPLISPDAQAAGDDIDATVSGSLISPEKQTYSTLNFKTNPKMKPTTSGSHLPLISPDPQATEDYATGSGSQLSPEKQTYNTLTFKTKPKMKPTTSGSHLPLISPESNLPQETGDDTYSVLGPCAVSRGTTAAVDVREKREVAAGVYSTIEKPKKRTRSKHIETLSTKTETPSIRADEVAALYSTVDISKKKKNRENKRTDFTSSSRTPDEGAAFISLVSETGETNAHPSTTRDAYNQQAKATPLTMVDRARNVRNGHKTECESLPKACASSDRSGEGTEINV